MLAIAAIPSAIAASNNSHAPDRCKATDAMNQYWEKNPNALKEAMAFSKLKFNRPVRKHKNAINNGDSPNGESLKIAGTDPEMKVLANPDYVIPVVFHVYGTNFNGYSVNDALIEDALTRTNEDIQGLGPDYGSVISEFSAIKDSLSVEFRLAKKDPNGNATTGIVYHPNACGAGNYGDANVAADNWNNYKYMNVYIQNDLYCDGSTTNSGVAWYPDTYMSDQGIARVAYNGAYLGNNTSENFRSVLTHEFGHYMNLIHTFEGGCKRPNENQCSTSGDQICDTPQVDNSGLQGSNCLGQMTNWQNFMHYSDQYANFTIDQVNRMNNAMNHAARSNLWTQSNLIATGTDNGGGGSNQLPTANINGPYTGQVGSTISFSSSGSSDSDGSITSYAWNFGDGNTSNSANPNHTFNTAGSYNISLTVTDDQGGTGTSSTTADITAGDQVLQSGVTVTGLSASTGNDLVYYIDVPAGASELIIKIDNGSGDADLYTQFNSTPTDSNYACRPYIGGNRETCSHTNPNQGRWYARVKAYSAFSNVSLTATVTTSGGGSNTPPVAVVNGPYSGIVGQQVSFSSAGSNDSDGVISSYTWDFGDGATSNSANTSHSYSAAGSYTVSLTVVDDQGASQTASTIATISDNNNGIANACATQGPMDYVNIDNGIPLCATSGNGGSLYYYFYNNGATQATIRTEHGSGNVGLYYSGAGWPTTSNYQQRSVNGGNTETIQINNLPTGWNYIMLSGSHSDVTLQVDY
jgi:PKD repeat protein